MTVCAADNRANRYAQPGSWGSCNSTAGSHPRHPTRGHAPTQGPPRGLRKKVPRRGTSAARRTTEAEIRPEGLPVTDVRGYFSRSLYFLEIGRGPLHALYPLSGPDDSTRPPSRRTSVRDDDSTLHPPGRALSSHKHQAPRCLAVSAVPRRAARTRADCRADNFSLCFGSRKVSLSYAGDCRADKIFLFLGSRTVSRRQPLPTLQDARRPRRCDSRPRPSDPPGTGRTSSSSGASVRTPRACTARRRCARRGRRRARPPTA